MTEPMTEPMTAESAWAFLATERRAFADLLDTFSPEQWETPSLCGAWTVREVTTHLMVGQTGSLGSFLTAMVAARGRFERANQVMVERKISRPTSAIVADLRTHAEHRFTPPRMDWHAPLTDFLVHRLDVLVPLGLQHDAAAARPLDGWPAALGFVASPAGLMGFIPKGLPALTYVAPDVDWSTGSGPRVEAPAEDLALAITRRPVRLDALHGPGADALAAWARRG